MLTESYLDDLVELLNDGSVRVDLQNVLLFVVFLLHFHGGG